jgi:cellulose synthase/poly-beta-1,6-N-acetylglucosamine synthase-like glycosyltransferase
MPDTFSDYKKQRSRWAYGAMQIMKRHVKALLGLKAAQLTRGQRYHFLAGWLPWIADGVNLFFTLAAMVWSTGMILSPTQFDPPPIIFAILPISLFCFKIAKIIYLYRTTVHASLRHTLSAAWAGLALSHTIAVAVVRGLFTSNEPFYRTPKLENPSLLVHALLSARSEVLFALLLWGFAVGVYVVQPAGGLDLYFWILLLFIQSLPYLSAAVMAIVSGLPALPAYHDPDSDPQRAIV